MTADRLFTDEELKALGQRTVDLLEARLEVGDTESAKKLAQRMYGEFSAMHDLYRDWVTHLLTILGRRFGDNALAHALHETVADYSERMGSRYAGKSARRRLEILAAGFRGHLQPFDIEEDDEKFTITPKVCGSGERLVRDGCYEPPRNYLKIKNAQPMTFFQEEFPVYCAHCYFQNIIPAEPGGEPLFKTEPADKLGESPCKIYVYK